MTLLEQSMQNMIEVFHSYVEKDGDGKTLSKKQLKKLLETELPEFLKAQKNPNIVDNIMKDLDQNKDDKLNFEEFVPFVAGLVMACEKCFQKKDKK
ncbi:protein S100-A10b [Gouania willdenowi]|uniref:Protein S100 n=1 Tax=Gouania willdenowi TaxID=441366 RepID=A0A8C5N1J6_GOUWI|nr:protein S100-A1-like [Gouania willdenowi]